MSYLEYDTFEGLVFGEDESTPDDERYPLASTPGIEGIRFDGADLQAVGHGAGYAPMWADVRSWVSEIEIQAGTREAWDAKVAALRAATGIDASRWTERPYSLTRGEVVRTIFARVVSRDFPRDRLSVENLYALASVGFAAIDPVIYGPEQTLTFTGASDSEALTPDGWTESFRWRWTVPGPVTNPQVSSSLGGTIRYVGSISSTQTLVVECFPVGHSPGYYAKLVDDADVADYADPDVGTDVYGSLDGGASASQIPPPWFPIGPDDVTISYSATSGTGGSTFAYREGFD